MGAHGLLFRISRCATHRPRSASSPISFSSDSGTWPGDQRRRRQSCERGDTQGEHGLAPLRRYAINPSGLKCSTSKASEYVCSSKHPYRISGGLLYTDYGCRSEDNTPRDRSRKLERSKNGVISTPTGWRRKRSAIEAFPNA